MADGMQKVQVFLTKEQKQALERIAARTGKKQSELIREGVERVVREAEDEKADWREATRRAAGMWADRDDLDEFYADLRQAASDRLDRLLND